MVPKVRSLWGGGEAVTNYVLDARGEPKPEPDVHTWAHWFEKANRHVGSTMVGKMHVSTVFLGIDHSFGRAGPPVLWETMIFYTPDGSDHTERYTSKEKALAGHLRAIETAKDLQLQNARGPTL